jgi:hypothetical protein
LRPTGLSIDAAALQLAEAHKKLNGAALLDAVEYYVKRNPHTLPRKSVADVYSELLDAKAKDGLSNVYLRELKVRLGKFSKLFIARFSA